MGFELPDMIVEEILSRLPVKSLLRFRSVCKAWRSRIFSTDFRKLQLKRASKINKLIVLEPNYRLTSVDCNTSNRIDYGSTSGLPKLPSFSKGSGLKFYLVGSVNGLVCVYTMKYKSIYIYIWNPCTNEYKKIPFLKHSLYCGDMIGGLCGFGYDVSTDDYTLLIATHKTYYSDGTINLFSFRKGIWVSFKDACLAGSTVNSKGVFLNGAIFWVCSSYRNGIDVPLILSFGLAEECFKEVYFPDFEKDRIKYGQFDHGISVLDGVLCLLVVRSRNIAGDPDSHFVWTMKKDGVRSSWSELTILPERGNLITYSAFPYILQGKFICHWNKWVKKCYYGGDAIAYTETLISLEHKETGKQAKGQKTKIQRLKEKLKFVTGIERSLFLLH